jgi:ubiquinone/menaquinone biosynthesis C-methylase UbiE
MRRQPSLELLDRDAGTPQEIAASLRDLQMFNQFFGGVRTSEALVRRAASKAGARELSLLEVAAGSGYVPDQVRRRLQPSFNLKTTFLDRSRMHLNGNGRSIAADALALPFEDSSFDLASCNLFVHHLAPVELQQFAREALRVCRVAFLINDVIRHPVHLALTYAGFPLYRSRITRNDAPASVRQGYTPSELLELLSPLGISRVEMSRHYLYRMGVIVWKHA